MTKQWLNEEFYVVVYNDGGEEKKEEFKTYTEAFEFYENLVVDSANGEYKVLQKVVEWENGEEYIEVVEEE